MISRLHIGLSCVLLLGAGTLQAAQIGDYMEEAWLDQTVRFWSLEDAAVRYALIGSLLLGLLCGLLGSFIVVRKMALFGDTLAHAVLPGVALGFMWNMTKDPLSILIGATVAGALGALTVAVLRQTTILKEDAAMGMVLSGFYGVGICLLTMIQNLPVGNKAGLDRYMFGQAAALASEDLYLIALVTALAVLLLTLFYKEYLLVSFDMGFARVTGLPAGLFHYIFVLLLSFAIVVSLQAVGILLITAMLVTPAASAYLLTDRMHRMLLYASCFGAFAGVLGAFFSFLGSNLPTGPFMVLAASSIFVLCYLFGGRYGVVPRWIKWLKKRRRYDVENTLKAIFHVREVKGFETETVTIGELRARLNESHEEVFSRVRRLEADGVATLDSVEPKESPGTDAQSVHLTPVGWARACQIVRNHRLWELYLTYAADYPVDHVHEDAEIIEHMLGEDTVRKLEKRLNFPTQDPHGKLIPGVMDLEHPQRPHVQAGQAGVEGGRV